MTRLVHDRAPDVVGLSVMTFQRTTALRIIALVRVAPARACAIVVGGYDPASRPRRTKTPESGVDVIVRGEGDLTFRELLRALDGRRRTSTASPGCRTGAGRRSSGRRPRPVSRARHERRPAARIGRRAS